MATAEASDPPEEKLKAEGNKVHLTYPGRKDPEYAGISDFPIAKLKPSKPCKQCSRG